MVTKCAIPLQHFDRAMENGFQLDEEKRSSNNKNKTYNWRNYSDPNWLYVIRLHQHKGKDEDDRHIQFQFHGFMPQGGGGCSVSVTSQKKDYWKLENWNCSTGHWSSRTLNKLIKKLILQNSTMALAREKITKEMYFVYCGHSMIWNFVQ